MVLVNEILIIYIRYLLAIVAQVFESLSSSNLETQATSLCESENDDLVLDLININGDLTSSPLSLLKQKLPLYVVNCFLSLAFDEIEVLCSMEKIEKFIQKKFAYNTDHNLCPSLLPFEFPPGHRT